MTLLFDQTLPARLVALLADRYPEATHVRLRGLAEADDETIWDYARRHNLIIVSKDSDSYHRAMRYGPPPKGIWLRVGNCTTARLEQLLRERHATIRAFIHDAEAAFLPLD